MKRSGEGAKRRTWAAAAWALIGALALGGCLAESGGNDAVDSTCVGGSGVTGGMAIPSNAAATGTSTSPRQDCTVVDIDGQPVCKLNSGRICTTNAECASGVCKTIVVPPDPHDPYDLGYSYTGCE